ncbi:disease resistance protein At4g27190-like [Apium graveolens]|uniref:disease resistance protein At4g27190-like n=1 Tax=Apium graveolens TaxID=4045 RepID=UPI003D7A831B
MDRISDATVDVLFRGFRYMFCYKDLANVLDSEIGKLDIEDDRVSRKVVSEKANGKTIEDHVLKWQKEVEEIQESVKDFSKRYKSRSSWRCIQCLPIPKPVTRFKLGREATQKTKRVIELYGSGKDLLDHEIAYLPAFEGLPTTDSAFQNFESRQVAYGMLWEALVVDSSSLIIGIYGMPGVGKTRMVEQIWKEVKEKKIFDKVARADVGNDELDVIKLQNQIAGHLDCHFESQDNVDHRASQLKNCLLNGGKILVILDDVWRDIPLDIIGIPLVDGSSSKGFKILLTSREEHVCLRNNCKHPIKITTLTVNEAWGLFRNTVGASQIDSLQDESLARKVCDKCAGLPLLIRAIGKALQFSSRSSWKDALSQLERGKFENIAGIDPQVYACVKLSIDRLLDDAKSCLFLCSLYPEDAVIYIRMLIKLATGTLVPDGESRVCAMVDVLRSSSLLLDSEKDHEIKLHDLIRDVARSIAARDPKYAFSVARGRTRLPDNVDFHTRKLLHLHMETNDFQFPGELVCPDLHCLWLQCNKHIQQFSSGFFSMFANLRFLLIEGMVCSSELHSLQPLGKLRTLILDHCEMTQVLETNDSFFPVNLETLCFWECNLLQLNLPNQKYLRKLEIESDNCNFVQMVANTISNLSSLEELHLPSGLHIKGDGSETSQEAAPLPILLEISKLTKLKSMNIFLKYLEPFQDGNIFGNLLEFNIYVGKPGWKILYHLHSSVSFKRVIVLHGNQFKVLEGLIETAEVVVLNCTDVNMSTIYNSNREAFADLSVLCIENCNTMGHLARKSQDESHYSLQPRTSFSKLVRLSIRGCSATKYLFNSSAANCLVQLQELNIENCVLMEAIIMHEGTGDGDIISFSNLKSLKLERLPRLKGFYRENKDTCSSSTSIPDKSAFHSVQSQPLFDGMVAFPSLELLDICHLENTSDIWKKYICDDSVSNFCKLRSLKVDSCNKLETLIPHSMLQRLRNLEILETRECNGLRNVFLQSSVARDLIRLKKMKVWNCEMMREIIGTGQQEKMTDGIEFPELTTLELVALPNLASFWGNQCGKADNCKVKFPELVKFLFDGVKINLEPLEWGKDDSTCQLKSLSISCDHERQLPCTWRPQLRNLEKLEVVRCWPHELNSLCFQQLKVLKVYGCSCSTMFSFSAFKSLQQLQELRISDCALLEEIVEYARGDENSGMDKETITHFQLRSVILEHLPSLKSFMRSANHESDMSNICGVSTLFTLSAFRTLQQLQFLEVKNCRLLEGIVEDVRGDETSFKNEEIVTLYELGTLTLRDLPNLKSFSSTSRYAFNMPKLKGFTLLGCPQMEFFTFLKASTGLVTVFTESLHLEEFQDLNDFIRQNRQQGSNINEESRLVKIYQEVETESERVEEEQYSPPGSLKVSD